MKLACALTAVILAGGVLAACGDDDDGGGSGGTAGTGGGSGASGSGGSAGSGDSGACKSCSEMVATAESDLTKACAGDSATLTQAFVVCTCQPNVCGGPGLGCETACTGGQIDQACIDCDQTAAAGPCKTEFDACMADN